MKKFLFLGLLVLTSTVAIAQKPVRVAVAGITHGHVPWILGRKPVGDIELVGIAESNQELSQRYASRYKLDPKLFYKDLTTMLDQTKPEAVVAFGSIYEHKAVVEACAPRGIHVMVEKPLSTNVKDAERMAELSRKHHTLLLTNYETSWYPSIEKTYQLVMDSTAIGKFKKMVVHTGHEGPKEINVNPEFFEWLTDPVQNGGGALIDFGCYGANLMTYFMKNEKPLSVTAVTHQFKPHMYPKVDDDATIVIEYPHAQCIVQASWNWPYSRKDLEVYGDGGYVITENQEKYKVRSGKKKEEKRNITKQELPVYDDPFAYFADLIRGKIKPHPLYSLENNLIVVRILEAARESAKTGKMVKL
ncbi:Gfo/Idh/MocA family protein [Siphonobacter sp. SORGH_AS_1065]|uniref:Gfo/Idh/MocA family protein n=1 Tax=Siphonobacter sp. SORGH_AS_1065 TaxID=3041795 RepID=UPI002788ADB5|nr:Gfo/Idh/MocA family oxidoreductase [Siphonobacter sp. SORGH_AS_1065]MDQ1087311.1 putative dehydrogenase [Siphonobacter sp. SORGH_AS_1065]